MSKLKECAREVLEDIGVKEGDIIFDCCCGSGTYTIPAAKLVGEKGFVYAIDRSSNKLNDLRQKVNTGQLKNVKVLERDVELSIPLPKNSIDKVLLFDIFWYFRPGQRKLSNLLKEVHKIIKQNALISVYPTHVNYRELELFKSKMNNTGFRLEDECSRLFVHEDNLEQGKLLNYKTVEVITA